LWLDWVDINTKQSLYLTIVALREEKGSTKMIIIEYIKKYLHYWMILSIGLGLANVYLFGGLSIPKGLIVFLVVFLVIFPVMINTKFEEVFAHLKEPRPLFCSFFLNFVLSPLIALLFGKIFLSDQPQLFTALIILSLVPTSAMSAAWTSFSGAKMATALYLIPANLLFTAFVGLPFILPLFIGDIMSVEKINIIKTIFLVFIIPLILGDLTRRVIIKIKDRDFFNDKIKPNLASAASIGILILVFLIMSLKRNALLLQNLDQMVVMVPPVILFYILLYLISTAWTWFLIRSNTLPGEKAVVVIYTSVARHINISLALIFSSFTLEQSSSMILLIMVAYVIQVPSLAFFAQHYGKRIVNIGKPQV
jgi:arsenite transporter